MAELKSRLASEKTLMAVALESPKGQQDTWKAHFEYVVKDLPTIHENTDGYSSYSWLRWLPFMDCKTEETEVRYAIQLINICGEQTSSRQLHNNNK